MTLPSAHFGESNAEVVTGLLGFTLILLKDCNGAQFLCRGETERAACALFLHSSLHSLARSLQAKNPGSNSFHGIAVSRDSSHDLVLLKLSKGSKGLDFPLPSTLSFIPVQNGYKMQGAGQKRICPINQPNIVLLLKAE